MVALSDDVAFTTVLFAEEDCVALETAEEFVELALTLPFLQISDKLPGLAVSQCLVKFKLVPLHETIGCVLLVEQISVKLRWMTVPLACKVAFCDVQFEIVALHEAVALTAVEFCRVALLLLDVVFTDDTFAATTVSFKGAPFA